MGGWAPGLQFLNLVLVWQRSPASIKVLRASVEILSCQVYQSTSLFLNN